MDCEYGGYLTPHCKYCRHWLDGSSWDFGCGNLYFKDCPHLKPVETTTSKPKYEYVYRGAVFIFDDCVEMNWFGKTIATSAFKARSNLTYQWKKENGYAPNAKVRLSGKITRIG